MTEIDRDRSIGLRLALFVKRASRGEAEDLPYRRGGSVMVPFFAFFFF